MAKIYLISEKYLKSSTIIDDSVEYNIIQSAIETAQSIRLTELIGSENVEKLKRFVENPECEDNVFLKEALDSVIVPFLAAQIVSEVQIPLQYKLKAQGVIQAQNDNYTGSTLKDIQYLKEYYENIANSYAEKVVEFYNRNNKEDIEETNVYTCSIYFPR